MRHKSIEMSFLELLLIAVGLSMDAFSVSICKGLTTKKFSWRMAIICALWFGGFQVMMPVIGYFLGAQFEDFIDSFFLAIATSIDALAVGVSFACIQVNLWSSVLVIGLTTFVFSVLGVKIGNVFGAKYEKSAGIIGGIILIIIGLKILLEHLGIISF